MWLAVVSHWLVGWVAPKVFTKPLPSTIFYSFIPLPQLLVEVDFARPPPPLVVS